MGDKGNEVPVTGGNRGGAPPDVLAPILSSDLPAIRKLELAILYRAYLDTQTAQGYLMTKEHKIQEGDTSLVRTSLLDVIYAMLRAEKEITRIQFDNRTYPHRYTEGPSLQDEPISPTMAYFIGVKHGLLKALDLDETTDTFYFTYFR